MMTKEKLAEMADIDIRTVSKDSLVDIDSIQVDPDLSTKDKVKSYIEQIKNPYCYVSHGIVVKVSFAGKSSLEDCLSRSFAI
ncbi:DUF6870 family protein [Streptococcus alactolyticus]|uniref:DUF6870 family protein n=1 Tax=Streptococcus alactolyticus TaxID=29389 RepID=UPI003F9A2EDF